MFSDSERGCRKWLFPRDQVAVKISLNRHPFFADWLRNLGRWRANQAAGGAIRTFSAKFCANIQSRRGNGMPNHKAFRAKTLFQFFPPPPLKRQCPLRPAPRPRGTKTNVFPSRQGANRKLPPVPQHQAFSPNVSFFSPNHAARCAGRMRCLVPAAKCSAGRLVGRMRKRCGGIRGRNFPGIPPIRPQSIRPWLRSAGRAPHSRIRGRISRGRGRSFRRSCRPRRVLRREISARFSRRPFHASC